MIDQKDVTIIIPHLGATSESKYALEECAKSLVETVPGVITRDRGLIVVTNGYNPATDGKPNQVGDMHLVDQGQCKAVNAAVATVNTPWVLVTNDDMIYPPGWWEKLTDFHGQDVQCISPKLVEPRSGAPTFLVEFCGGAGGDFDKQKFLDFVEQYDRSRKGGNKAIIGPGFNLPFLIKKELWDTIGGYDVNYDPWGSNSDSDLEYKIKLAGVNMWQHQEALVYHFSQTSGTFNPENQGAWQRNWDYFIQKWGFPRTDGGIWQSTFQIPDEGRKFRPDWEGKYGKS